MLIYIHGFNSSPASMKAQKLKARLAALGREAEFAAPALPHAPAQAAALLDALVARHPGAALVGSSLGGYYAAWLAERHARRAALLNPAVRPYELLAAHLGPQQNLYTGERYELTQADVDALRALEPPEIRPERYLLLVATGDEVLDHRDALARFRGARTLIVEGGDHALTAFPDYIDEVLAFLDARA